MKRLRLTPKPWIAIVSLSLLVLASSVLVGAGLFHHGRASADGGLRWSASPSQLASQPAPTDHQGDPWYDRHFQPDHWDSVSLPDVDSIPAGSDRYYRGKFVGSIGQHIGFSSDDSMILYVNDVFLGEFGGFHGAEGCVNMPGCTINTNYGAIDISPYVHPGDDNIIAVRVNNAHCCGSSFWLDFVVPSATPSPAPTPTASPTPTIRPATATAVPTPTATRRPSPTPSPTRVATPTRSPRPQTPTPRPSPSPTRRPTNSPRPSPTPTASPTPTRAPSRTPVHTPTRTPRRTPTPATSATQTASPTPTPHVGPTQSHSATPTPVVVRRNPTPTPTATPTVTPSPRPTALPAKATRAPTPTPAPLAVQPPKDNPGRPNVFRVVPTIGSLSTDPKVVSTSFGLAVFTLILLILSAAILNQTLEENEVRIRAMLAAVAAPFAAVLNLTAGVFESPDTHRQFVRSLLPTCLVLLAAAVVYALEEPGAGLNEHSLVLFLSYLGVFAFVTYSYEGAQLIMSRRYGAPAVIRVFPIGVAVALLAVSITRITGFQPGLMYGFIAAHALVGSVNLTEEQEGKQATAAAVALLGASIIAWLLVGPLREFARDNDSWWAAVPEGIAAGLFVAGLESLFFQMIPIDFMDGRKIMRWNKIAWLGLAIVTCFLFWDVLLNDDQQSVQALEHTRTILALTVVAMFFAATIVLWMFFRALGPYQAGTAEATAD